MKNHALKVTALSIVAVMVVALVAAVSFVAAPANKSANVTATVDDKVVSEAVAYALGNYTNPYITYQTAPLISAHRAGGALAPENTMMAFMQCLKADKGYEVDVLEFDLHLTADDELILLHDDTFDRTSDCQEVFGETEVTPRSKTLAQLKRLNLGAKFETESGSMPYVNGVASQTDLQNLRVVTLEEVLDYTESTESGLRYIIEIKDSGGTGRIATDRLYNVLKERNMINRVVVGTFNGDITDYMDATYPDFIRSAGIIEVLRIFFCYLLGRDLGNVGYEVLQVPYVSYFPFLGSANFIKYAHSYNIACQFWTINESDKMQTLINNGADCIITDNPKVGYETLVNMNKVVVPALAAA